MTNDTIYLWDLISPLTRFILLNQTRIQNIWNVKQAILLNQTKLDWSSLPSYVKSILVNDTFQQSLINMTFSNWGWTDSTSQYANVTLFSLIPSKYLLNLPNITNILSNLRFNLVLNTTILAQSFLELNLTQFPSQWWRSKDFFKQIWFSNECIQKFWFETLSDFFYLFRDRWEGLDLNLTSVLNYLKINIIEYAKRFLGNN